MSARNSPRARTARRRAERQAAAQERTKPSAQRNEGAGELVDRPLDRSDFIHAAIATAAAFAVYAICACRTIFGGDSAELAAAAAVRGVPHPPGYPLYTTLTAAIVRVLPVNDAFAANLASGLFGALAVGAVWLLARRLGASRGASWFAAAALASGDTFFAQCVAAEVYTLDSLLLAVTLGAAVALRPAAGWRPWLVIGVLVGLWLGHRPVNVLYVPAVAILLLVAGAHRAQRRELLIGAGAAALAVALPYVYMAVRSAADPAIDIGDPQRWDRFLTVITASPYTRHLESNSAHAAARIGHWFVGLPRELAVAAPLAAIGAVTWFRRRGRLLWIVIALLWIALVDVAFSSRYAVLDIAVFFLPATLVLAVLAAVGADRVLTWVPRVVPMRAAAVVVALLGATTLPWSAARNNVSANHWTRNFGEDVFASLPPRALLIVGGDTPIHASWYLQGVEGLRRDVVILSTGHLYAWYLDQLRARYPDDAWPQDPSFDDQIELAREIVDALGKTRPVFVTYSVDPSPYLAPSPTGTKRSLVPHGLVAELVVTGNPIDLPARAAENERLLDTAFADLDRDPELDMDSKSTLVIYALAASRAAELAERAQLPAVACRDYQRVISLDPDRHQRDIEEDVRTGLGEDIPPLRLGEQAHNVLPRLCSAPPGK